MKDEMTVVTGAGKRWSGEDSEYYDDYVSMQNEIEEEAQTYPARVKHARRQVQIANANLHKLLEQCTHEELVPQEKYYEGGYDYVAHTEYWDRCKVCAKIFNKRTVQYPGRYG